MNYTNNFELIKINHEKLIELYNLINFPEWNNYINTWNIYINKYNQNSYDFYSFQGYILNMQNDLINKYKQIGIDVYQKQPNNNISLSSEKIINELNSKLNNQQQQGYLIPQNQVPYYNQQNQINNPYNQYQQMQALYNQQQGHSMPKNQAPYWNQQMQVQANNPYNQYQQMQQVDMMQNQMQYYNQSKMNSYDELLARDPLAWVRMQEQKNNIENKGQNQLVQNNNMFDYKKQKTINVICILQHYINLIESETPVIFNGIVKDEDELIKEFKDFLKKESTQKVLVKLLLDSKRIRVIDDEIVCNYNQYGYWEAISTMSANNKYDVYCGILYLKSTEYFQYGLDLSNINRIIGRSSLLWNDIEKRILDERNFRFENIEEKVSLKERVRNNIYINFKNFIVNPITLEVIQKQTRKINDKDIDNTIISKFDEQGNVIQNIALLDSDLIFDYYIDADPIVIQKNGILKISDQINASAFNYFCETSLGGNIEKRKLLLQHLGYIISSNKDKKKVLYILGAANTGKSILLNLFMSYFKPKWVSHLALSKLKSDDSKSILMKNKLNVADEVNETIQTLRILKNLVSGSIDSYIKKSGVEAEEKYNIGIVFAANRFIKPLKSLDEIPTDYLDKFSLLETFDFDFKKADIEKHLDIGEKLLTEKDEIITLALYELKELYANGFQFIELEDDLKEKVDHVNLWIESNEKKMDIKDIKRKLKGCKYSPFEEKNQIFLKEIEDKKNLPLIKEFIEEELNIFHVEIDDEDINELESKANCNIDYIQRNIIQKNIPTECRISRQDTINLYKEYIKEKNISIKGISDDNIIDGIKNFLRKNKIFILDVNNYKDEKDTQVKEKKMETLKEEILKALKEKHIILLYKDATDYNNEVITKNNEKINPNNVCFVGLSGKEMEEKLRRDRAEKNKN